MHGYLTRYIIDVSKSRLAHIRSHITAIPHYSLHTNVWYLTKLNSFNCKGKSTHSFTWMPYVQRLSQWRTTIDCITTLVSSLKAFPWELIRTLLSGELHSTISPPKNCTWLSPMENWLHSLMHTVIYTITNWMLSVYLILYTLYQTSHTPTEFEPTNCNP